MKSRRPGVGTKHNRLKQTMLKLHTHTHTHTQPSHRSYCLRRMCVQTAMTVWLYCRFTSAWKHAPSSEALNEGFWNYHRKGPKYKKSVTIVSIVVLSLISFLQLIVPNKVCSLVYFKDLSLGWNDINGLNKTNQVFQSQFGH